MRQNWSGSPLPVYRTGPAVFGKGQCKAAERLTGSSKNQQASSSGIAGWGCLFNKGCLQNSYPKTPAQLRGKLDSQQAAEENVLKRCTWFGLYPGGSGQPVRVPGESPPPRFTAQCEPLSLCFGLFPEFESKALLLCRIFQKSAGRLCTLIQRELHQVPLLQLVQNCL